MEKFLKNFKDLLLKSKDKAIYFFKHNILFLVFVITSLINGFLLRFLTVKNYTNISPILADLSFILFVGSVAYFFKPRYRFRYYITWSIIIR